MAIYDLELRTMNFTANVRSFVRMIPQNMLIKSDIIQLVRSSGSVGANYIEANESLSRKDFLMRMKICRKEAKESNFWLAVLVISPTLDLRRKELMTESKELELIFGSMIRKIAG